MDDQRCALIVGFNWKDELAIQREWFASGLRTPIRFAADVFAAKAFLKGRQRWKAGIVLIEWKEQDPLLLQFIHWLRMEPAMREIIVMICAADCNDETVKTAYANGADCCARKTDDFSEVLNLFKRVEHHWFEPVVFGAGL